ncbi:hypothetical protein RUM43_012450 [Polyplax serrata]|uniref:Solute carrier family 25 member 32 n=1 Tax=Polyplax serrata TaxID=468196 RepID=A0AAN8RSZ4_POLSC
MTTMKSSSTNRFIPDNFPKLPNLRYEHFLGGISGGVTSTLILHPLDLIKIRFAVNDGRSTHTPQYANVRNAFKLIVKEEGIRGLYKGVTANIWGSGSSWGLYFLYYNSLKIWLQDGDSKQPLGSLLHMFAAAQAGLFTLIMTNPIWVVKTRLCLQRDVVPGGNSSQTYNGMIDGLVKIYRNEGMRGLYKGFVPGLFGVSHGSIQFMVYEEMKNSYNKNLNRPINEKLTTPYYLSFAAISKLIAAAVTYPYQVVRARLQDQNHSYAGTLDCIRKIFRYEGLSGFYKGMVPYALHVTPNVCVILLIYEKFSENS